MNIKKTLSKDTLSLHLTGTDKESILKEMVDLLVASGKVKDPKLALKDILEREKKMSTGMQNGVAIPHAKSEAVDGLIAALGIKREGIDFQSLDGQLSTIFVMTLSPAKRAGPHIQFLAEISRILNDQDTREKIIGAETIEEVLALISNQ